MNVERTLEKYLQSKGPKIKYSTFCDLVKDNDSNDTVNALFKLINNEIDNMQDGKTLDRVVEVMTYLEVLITNKDNVNRNIIIRKLNALNHKLDIVEYEWKNRFININAIKSELNKVRRKIDEVLELADSKDTKQYDFIDYLANEAKDIRYIEYAFHKMPSLATVKDKDSIPLFRNIIKKYLLCLEDNIEEDILYYDNLISLIMSSKSFKLNPNEKKACLELIYKFLDKSNSKKKKKKNDRTYTAVEALVNKIKGEEKRKNTLDILSDKYHVNIFFEDEVLKAAKLAKVPKEGVITDREVIEGYTISIDKGNAKQLDDCLTCRKLPNGHYELIVSIASVLSYFPYYSEIVQEAINRNHSIYLPVPFQHKDDDFSRTITIFPYDFAAKIGSLKEENRRFARSYIFEIDEEGNVVSERFVKSVVTNNKRLSFEEADHILEKGSDNKELEETLRNLQNIAAIIGNKYKGSDLYSKVKEYSDDPSGLRVNTIGSENIVYQSTLLTGIRVGEWFAKNDYPCIYKVFYEDEDTKKKLQDMIDNLIATYGGEQYKNLYQLIVGIYPKSWYDTEGRHDGLGADHFVHCTSELRRAADIIVEHCLEVCYDKIPTEQELQELREEIVTKVVEINAQQNNIEWFLRDYKKTFRKS